MHANQAPSGGITSDRRLFTTADQQTAVEEGDPRAAFLLCGPGAHVSSDDAAKLGLSVVDGKVVIPGKPADKARTPKENKGRTRKKR